jgi:MSHA biogenesis protein MshJ
VNKLLARLAERIDGATLRERAMIFAAAALALLAAAQILVLDPLLTKERALSRQVAQRQAELKAVQVQLVQVAQRGDPAEPVRRRLAELRQRTAELDAALAGEQGRFTPPEAMRGVLQEILERNRRLQLVDFKTLPAVRLESGSKAAGAAPAGRVFRHGVEVTVRGGYFDLQAYLGDLEKLSTRIYWGRAELAASDYPRGTLRLMLYTLSFERAWMLV